MRDDPFARLGGLDQQLFAKPSPPSPVTGTASGRAPIDGETGRRPSDRPAARTAVGTSAVTSHRSDGGASAVTAQPDAGRRAERTDGGPVRRKIDRRSYDFFHDQVLWLNRMKVELEERYDLQITANAMVQLALDLLILDHRRRGRHSQLMAHLVFGQPLEGEAKGGTEGRPDGATAGGSEGGE